MKLCRSIDNCMLNLYPVDKMKKKKLVRLPNMIGEKRGEFIKENEILKFTKKFAQNERKIIILFMVCVCVVKSHDFNRNIFL